MPVGQKQRRGPPQHYGHIRCHQRAVRDDIGVEGAECQCQQTGTRSEDVARPPIDERAQDQRHQNDRQAAYQRQPAGIGILPDHSIGDGG